MCIFARTNMFRLSIFILFFTLFSSKSIAQVSIGNSAPNASAMLEVNSSSKGFLHPRVALSSINDVSTIASPATGLLVINTATAGTTPNNVFPGYYYYDGSKWQHIFNPSTTFIKKSILVNSGAPSTVINGPNTVSAWSGSYTSSGGTVEIRANFTAYNGSTTSYTTFKLLRDGTEIDNVTYFFNSFNVHCTMPDLYAIIPNESGSHTYAIQIGSNTTIDYYDVATISVTETKFN